MPELARNPAPNQPLPVIHARRDVMHTKSAPALAPGAATFDSARYSALLPDATVTAISPSSPLSSEFLLPSGEAPSLGVASKGNHACQEGAHDGDGDTEPDLLRLQALALPLQEEREGEAPHDGDLGIELAAQVG